MGIINYYISDLHFGCQNKYEGRTLEHDNLIINNWNRVVTNSDNVYILGDIGRVGGNKDNEYLCKCISILKGRKTCILGNHDDMRDGRLKQLFVEVCDRKEIIDNCNKKSYKLVLLHSPELFWANQHKGSILLYGHLHMSDEWDVYKKCLEYVNDFFKDKTLKGYNNCPPAVAYNVGCMLHNYAPVTLEKLLGE